MYQKICQSDIADHDVTKKVTKVESNNDEQMVEIKAKTKTESRGSCKNQTSKF